MIQSDKLKEARVGLKLSQSAVAAETGIGGSSLSEFENGKREPRMNQLQSLARVYRQPLTFFFEEETPPRDAVLWRERPSQNAEAIEHDFLELCRRYSDLERWCGDVLSPDLPDITQGQDGFSFQRAAEVARKVGKELGLGDRPSFSLLQMLEDKCGIKIFHQDIDPTGTAASVRSGRYGWAVLLNSRSSQARRNFDLAHELFHLLTWEVFGHNTDEGPSESSLEEEKYANAFASHLLMPEDEVRSAVERRRQGGKLPLAAVVEIARQFQVSVEAMAWRIHSLYRLDQKKTEQAVAGLKGMRSQEQALSGQREEPSALPQRYQDLALRALMQGQISVGRFAEYTGVSVQEAMRRNEEGDLDAEIALTAH
jgi:Zn-dependent peptidase ImmA (M78 family)/transcriptional regulator with XRE-family HTH domain